MAMIRSLILALALTAPSWAGAAELQVPLNGRDPLVLDLPPAWQAQITRRAPDVPPTVTIASPTPGDFQILVTPIWPQPSAAAPTREQIKVLVQGATAQARSQAVESSLPLVDLAASGKAGYYFSATDRAPEPGGYRHLTQGAVAMGDLRVTFTILANGDAEQTRSQALEMLRSMRRAKAAAAR
jgi:hypothetical protein